MTVAFSDPDRTALYAAFIASALTSFGALGVAAYRAHKDAGQRAKDREAARVEARVADERWLREEQRKRVYPAYTDVIIAARAVRQAANRLGLLLAEETREERNAAVNTMLTKATSELDRPMVALRLEQGAEEVVAAFERVNAAWSMYSSYYLPRMEAGDRNHDEIAAALATIGIEAEAIEQRAKDHLALLTSPI